MFLMTSKMVRIMTPVLLKALCHAKAMATVGTYQKRLDASTN
jgi:hypothetical protein